MTLFIDVLKWVGGAAIFIFLLRVCWDTRRLQKIWDQDDKEWEEWRKQHLP